MQPVERLLAAFEMYGARSRSEKVLRSVSYANRANTQCSVT